MASACRRGSTGWPYIATAATYTRVVNWLTAVLALVGPLVGASITLLVDRTRGKRDQRHHLLELRRSAYVEYLAALHATSEGIREVPDADGHSESSRLPAARAAFRGGDLYAAREQVGLLAPAPVVRGAKDTFKCLRTLRDLVGAGQTQETHQYREVLGSYQLALEWLRRVMRDDLGTASPGDD